MRWTPIAVALAAMLALGSCASTPGGAAVQQTAWQIDSQCGPPAWGFMTWHTSRLIVTNMVEGRRPARFLPRITAADCLSLCRQYEDASCCWYSPDTVGDQICGVSDRPISGTFVFPNYATDL